MKFSTKISRSKKSRCLSRGVRGRVIGLNHAVLGEWLSASSLGINVLFTWAVNGNFDSNFAPIDFLAIHLIDGLLLQFLRRKRDESETAAFTGLITSLEFPNHESRNRSESNFGSRWLIGGEQLLELS